MYVFVIYCYITKYPKIQHLKTIHIFVCLPISEYQECGSGLAKVCLRVSQEISVKLCTTLLSSQGQCGMVGPLYKLTHISVCKAAHSYMATHQRVLLLFLSASLYLSIIRQLCFLQSRGEIWEKGQGWGREKGKIPKMETKIFYNLSSNVMYNNETIYYIYNSLTSILLITQIKHSRMQENII